VITAVHTLIYADDAERARAFLRDVVGWPHVDAGGGWLIFKTGPSELGVHPTEGGGQHHQISLMCDDLPATVEELRAKGATFSSPIQDQGFGLTVLLEVPGAGDLQLYQPRHPPAFDLADQSA
jgi:predicted enzyme related to lactoylglutathione lyase